MKAKRILCPVDFSSTSEAATEFAATLARENSAKLIIAHVEENPVPYGPGLSGELPSPMDFDHHAISMIVPNGVEDVERILLLGDPANELCNYAEANDVDLIVVGSHGRTGVGRLLFGSVAEAVVRTAKVPVITVKSKVAEPVEPTV